MITKWGKLVARVTHLVIVVLLVILPVPPLWDANFHAKSNVAEAAGTVLSAARSAFGRQDYRKVVKLLRKRLLKFHENALADIENAEWLHILAESCESEAI